MSKDNFNNMDKLEKADFINDNLRQGMSFQDIYNATLNNQELMKSREALLNQFKKAGYRVNEKPQNNPMLNGPASPPARTEAENKGFGLPANDKLLALMAQADNILEMLEWWKHFLIPAPSDHTDRLSLPLPQDGEEVRKTIRISNQVWEKWKGFCAQNPGYNEKDLMARALLFFIEEQ